MNEYNGSLLIADRIDAEILPILSAAGHIYKVFDKQDSGCVSYGVNWNGQKLFIKYSEVPEAVGLLENVKAFHKEVTHPQIPKLLHSFHSRTGFALVYEWVDGEVLSTPDFPGVSGRNRPDSPHLRFRKLPVEKVISALSTVYEIHAYSENKGFVAVDFYDGNIIYDFDKDEIRLCDFDHYVQAPFILEADRLYGSKRFMAPEEFVKGSLIDHRTNVFTMGAAAFVFLADGESRELKDWKACDELYRVAYKAVSARREDRYASVNEFYQEWLQAIV